VLDLVLKKTAEEEIEVVGFFCGTEIVGRHKTFVSLNLPGKIQIARNSQNSFSQF
jgi:hypothetical protein